MATRAPRVRMPALLVVDVVNHFDFEGGPALAARTLPVARRIRGLRERFDARGNPVVYVNDNWTDWRGGFAELVAACLEAGDDSARIAGVLAPTEAHFHVLKPRQSGFMHSALPALLEHQRVDALAVTGIATDACVLATALDAHMRNYPLWVPSDCTAAITPSRKSQALALLRHNTAASTLSTARSPGLFPSARR